MVLEFQNSNYGSFPKYMFPAPNEWGQKSADGMIFRIQNNEINVTDELSLCMKYRDDFIECATYYTKRFKFKFQYCATNYDDFVSYFHDMYIEGLRDMLGRATGLFLLLGIFDIDIETLANIHLDRYNTAINYFSQIASIEIEQNKKAAEKGAFIGSAIQMQGGGFGIRGAMKGVAQAELFNLGMAAYGAMVARVNSMSQVEKARVWSTFEYEKMFECVYKDYYNSFFTVIHLLSERMLIGNCTISISKETQTIFANLQNPLFPSEQFVATAVKIIERNPFCKAFYDVLEEKIGLTDELLVVKKYFLNI